MLCGNLIDDYIKIKRRCSVARGKQLSICGAGWRQHTRSHWLVLVNWFNHPYRLISVRVNIYHLISPDLIFFINSKTDLFRYLKNIVLRM